MRGTTPTLPTGDSHQTPPKTDDETVPIGDNPALNVVQVRATSTCLPRRSAL